MTRMLRTALKEILSDEEIRNLYGGFDIVGDIAVIKIPDNLLTKKQLIGKTLLNEVKPLKTVLMQITPVCGDYRTRQLELIAGEDKTTTLYREHGCSFKVNLASVYFSPRLSAERLRVAQMAQPGDTVTNLFAGVGTFSIVIAKKVPETKVYSIDINPVAHKLAVENVCINKVSEKVIPILGDARQVISEIEGKADRVLMPLPEKAANYLDVALKAISPPTGIIHYYTHTHAARRDEATQLSLVELNKSIGGRYELISHRIVREVGPRWYQVALDLKLSTSTSLPLVQNFLSFLF